MKTAAFVLLFACLAPGGLVDQQRWDQAERAMRRIARQAYRGLPQPVSRYLRRHGYTIPQSYYIERQHNAVPGRFNDDGIQDWAVLASRGGYSQILVFWSGSSRRVTRLARQLDSGYLQTVGEGKIGYSRGIEVAGSQYILDHYRAYGGPKPPPIKHDAINDCFSGKASVVRYYDGTRWQELQGAD